LDARRSALLEMIKQLQEEKNLLDKVPTSSSQGHSLVSSRSSEAEKISLFRSIFEGRDIRLHKSGIAFQMMRKG
jgi:hypothetical protein